MQYKGKIQNVEHIVFSDPSYDESVRCRYDSQKFNHTDFFVDLIVNSTDENIEGLRIQGTEFLLLLKTNENDVKLNECGQVSYRRTPGLKINTYDIGIDSACVALGVNDKATEILELKDYWQPPCSLNTLTDGCFGNVIEGVTDNQTSFVLFTGWLDIDTDYSIDDVVNYLQSQLYITDMEKDILEQKELSKEYDDLESEY